MLSKIKIYPLINFKISILISSLSILYEVSFFLPWWYTLKHKNSTSSQDGGIGRHTVPPCTTTRRTTNFETKNNSNWQKSEPCGSPTTKELKKKHSSRLVGGTEMGSWVKKTHGKVAAGGLGWAKRRLEDWMRRWLADWVIPHSRTDKPGGTNGEQDRWCNPGFQFREIKPQSLWLKTPLGVEAAVGETPSLTGKFVGETNSVLECTQVHQPGNQHQKGPICLWVAGEVTENWRRAEQVTLQGSASDTSPMYSVTRQLSGCSALVNT